MVSHAIFSYIDSETPASFSQLVQKNLIKKESGLDNILFSDDMEMAAADKFSGNFINSYIYAFNAGSDIILFCHTKEKQFELLNKLPELFKTGILSEEELNNKVKRILETKKKGLKKFYNSSIFYSYREYNQISAYNKMLKAEIKKKNKENLKTVKKHIKNSLIVIKDIRDDYLYNYMALPDNLFKKYCSYNKFQSNYGFIKNEQWDGKIICSFNWLIDNSYLLERDNDKVIAVVNNKRELEFSKKNKLITGLILLNNPFYYKDYLIEKDYIVSVLDNDLYYQDLIIDYINGEIEVNFNNPFYKFSWE